MNKYKIGYTQGVFDMFHIGHLNLLKNAKSLCDYLIVGVNSDRLVKEYKNKNTIIPENDRASIVEAISVVDKVILTDTLDKEKVFNDIKFDVIFVGNDWEHNPRWIKTKDDMRKHGVDVVFLPYTEGISSTKLREELKKNED
jgi:glycerol-3-phosphate cytidylyltransferase